MSKTLADAEHENFSTKFVEYMKNRVLVGFFKYGPARVNARSGDFPANIKQRVDKYLATGNTEWLVDAANFAMLEFMYPQHPEAHFQSTSAAESPGVVMKDGSQWFGAAGRDSG